MNRRLEGGGEDEKYMTGRRSRLNVVPRIGGRYGKWKDDKLREGVGDDDRRGIIIVTILDL